MSEDLIEEKVLQKTETGLKETKDFTARPPDFIGNDHNVCAWVANRNTEGEIIILNVKVGDLRLKLHKRFL